MNGYTTATPWKYEQGATAEELIRYAANRLSAVGLPVKPAKISRTIRKALRSGGSAYAKAKIDVYLDIAEHDLTWAGFELFVNGYADPTGAQAAQNVDRGRGA